MDEKEKDFKETKIPEQKSISTGHGENQNSF